MFQSIRLGDVLFVDWKGIVFMKVLEKAPTGSLAPESLTPVCGQSDHGHPQYAKILGLDLKWDFHLVWDLSLLSSLVESRVKLCQF